MSRRKVVIYLISTGALTAVVASGGYHPLLISVGSVQEEMPTLMRPISGGDGRRERR